MRTVIKCINIIKSNSKTERFLKKFCDDQKTDQVRLLFNTDIRWLSRGNCLKRFMELFDQVREFLNGKEEMDILFTTDGKAYMSYLTDIFTKQKWSKSPIMSKIVINPTKLIRATKYISIYLYMLL